MGDDEDEEEDEEEECGVDVKDEERGERGVWKNYEVRW